MSNERLQHIIGAFQQDGYEVDESSDVFTYQDQLGVRAHHRTAYVHGTDPKIRKKAFYVEGTARQMGYLTGLMAEPEVTQMAIDFADRIILEFIDPGLAEKEPWIGKALAALVELLMMAEDIQRDIPPELLDEMRGLADGCQAANPQTQVKFERVLELNAAVDVVLPMVYTLRLPKLAKKLPEATLKILEELFTHTKEERKLGAGPAGAFDLIKAAEQQRRLRVPIMCNAYSAFGAATKSGEDHYFGRDFMFPTCDIFQNVACHIVRRPSAADAGQLATASVTAPGFVGSVAVMNAKGVAAGVDMVPADCCNPDRPGVNSLLLIRHAVQAGSSAEEVVDTIVNAQRGVSWLYPVSDGANDKACTVEAGAAEELPFLDFPLPAMKEWLPNQTFLNNNQTAAQQNGAMQRWHDYTYDSNYFGFNPDLFHHFDKPYESSWMGEDAFIDATAEDKNCPLGFYFAPQREDREDLLITTNHYIIPEMRLTSMALQTTLISIGSYDDVQWRYDELNHLLYDAVQAGAVDKDRAWSIINFRAPDPVTEKQVHGSVSLFDLKSIAVKSLYGTYADEPVGITLLNYL